KSQLLIQQAQAELRQGNAPAAATAAKQAIDAGGAPVAAVAAYARAMAAQGKGKKASGLVSQAWAKAPHPALLAAYRVLIPGESALDWARRVESLAQILPDHPESRLAVAAASLDAQLWGQARNRLMSLTAEDSAPEIRARA